MSLSPLSQRNIYSLPKTVIVIMQNNVFSVLFGKIPHIDIIPLIYNDNLFQSAENKIPRTIPNRLSNGLLEELYCHSNHVHANAQGFLTGSLSHRAEVRYVSTHTTHTCTHLTLKQFNPTII